MSVFTESQQKLARALIECGAIKISKPRRDNWLVKVWRKIIGKNPYSIFRFSFHHQDSGGQLTDETCEMIADEIIKRITECGRFCRVTTTGSLSSRIVEIVAERFIGIGSLIVTICGRDGDVERVRGVYEKGDRVLILSGCEHDLENTLAVINYLEMHGMEATCFLCVVDDGGDGLMDQLREHGLNTGTIFDLRELLDFYLAEGLITRTAYSHALGNLQSKGL